MKERGQSLVEMAFGVLFILLLLSGAAEFGILFFQYVQIRDAAQEGAIYGSVFPYDVPEIENRIRGASDKPVDLSDPSVEVYISYPDGPPCEGNPIKINVVYYHRILMPFLPVLLGMNNIMLNGEVVDTILTPTCS